MPAVHPSPRFTVSTCHPMSDGEWPRTVGEALKALDMFAQTRARVTELERQFRWLGQTVHQAHHEGPLEGCPKATCQCVRETLKVAP